MCDKCKLVTLSGTFDNPLFDVVHVGPCDGSTINAYQATHPFPTVTFQVNNLGPTCPIKVKVQRDDEEEFEAVVQPHGQEAFTLSEVKRIRIQCFLSPGSNCSWEVMGLGISYCQCCQDDDD